MGRLAGKVAFVTGSGSGIGEAVALRFAEEGAAVICLDINESSALRVAETISGNSGKAIAVGCDVGDIQSMTKIRETVLSGFGGVDIVVNNAGVGVAGSIGTLNREDWQRGIDVNLSGAYNVTKVFWQHFVDRRRGVVINTSSVMGITGDAKSIGYCTAKAGLIAFTKCLAIDGAPHGIRANCVCPGFVDTPAMQQELKSMGNGSQALRMIEKQLPVGRMARSQEIANGFLFLASDDASYVTGATLIMDGGSTIGYRGSIMLSDLEGE
ncbi:MAG: SDR family NAD(P)-dependent oxidoreductase [Xanthomonadales bacterium]|nr:SDR family NAD(P)-dependent oxidoreductase [Xanthomonadales bacterium]